MRSGLSTQFRHGLMSSAGFLIGLCLIFIVLPSHPSQAQSTVDFELSWISSESIDSECIAWGDMDGDGDLDLAVGTRDEANLLYRNDGGGVFTEIMGALDTNTAWTASIAWGDMDGDGDLDLAVGNAEAANQLFRNNGDGSFNEVTNPFGSATTYTFDLAWGDTDGDGDLDLAVGNYGPKGGPYQANQLYRNDGNEVFVEVADALGTGTYKTNDVAWGDMDNDGDLDLAIGNYGEVNQLFRNDRDNIFTEITGTLGLDTAFTYSVTWGDSDNDGDLDLAVGNADAANQFFRNEGDGSFTEIIGAFSMIAEDTLSLAWGDANGDGYLDLVVGNSDSPNRLYRNVGGTFVEVSDAFGSESKESWGVAWGDMDNDGDPDLAVSNRYAVDQIFRNDGWGGLKEVTNGLGTTSRDSKSLAWGDMDGDGDLDLAIGNYNQNQIFRNDSSPITPGFNLVEIPDALVSDPRDTGSIAWGDMDNDGDLDLAVGNWNVDPNNPDGINRLYRNDGGGNFTEVVGALGPDLLSTWSLAWGDVDGDGDLDLAIGNSGGWSSTSEINQLFLNDGDGNFAEAVGAFGTYPRKTRSLAWGDMDNDGDLDLAVGNLGDINQIYRNDGNGNFIEVAGALGPDTYSTYSVVWGDTDGDGDLDLVAGNNGVNQFFRNDGGGTFTEIVGALSLNTDRTETIALGDMDGDGDLDLVSGNQDNVNQLYRNDGAGNFIEAPEALGPAIRQTQCMAWGDADNDGDLDLALGNNGINQIYENSRQGKYTLPNNSPTLTLSAPGSTESADFYARPSVLNARAIPIAYTLFDPEGDPAGLVQAAYSPDGGGHWLPAVATTDTLTQNLSSGVALTFDGDDDYAIKSLLNNAPSTEATVSFWMRSTDDGGYGTPFSYATADDFNELTIYNYSNFAIYVNDLWATTGVSATDGLWHHIALTWRSADGQVKLYKDGIGAYTGTLATGAGVSPAGTLVLGQDQDSLGGGFHTTDAFSGTLDEVRFWNAARTQADIQTDMARTLSGDEPGLVAYWPGHKGGENLLLDESGNHNDASLGNNIAMYKPTWTGSPLGNTHVYTWDTFTSGFFGQSDNVVVRLQAHAQSAAANATSTLHYPSSTSGPNHWPYATAQTFPFRVRGTLVQVYSQTVAKGNELADAIVYRLPNGETTGGALLADNQGNPFKTNRRGYLQGRGEIGIGDQLLALLPVHTSVTYEGMLHLNADDTAEPTQYAIKYPMNNAPYTATTVSLWTRSDDTAHFGTLFSYATGKSPDELTLWNHHNLIIKRGTDYAISGVSVADGEWHHIAVTWRSSDGQVKLYKDGTAAYTHTLAPGTVISPDGSLVLGQDQDSIGGNFQPIQAFVGDLDDVQIWNTAHTPEQILADMEGALSGDESGLVAYWGFNDPASATTQQCTDKTANGNTLTLHGNIWDGYFLGGYTVYHTNGIPTKDGLTAHTITRPGVQRFAVSAEHPLILFDLNVSLEWDASYDPLYLQQLEFDIKNASAYLYDFTDGQVALGDVTVFQNADAWGDAHIAVQATNRLRPYASIGGLRTDVISDTEHPDLVFGPGQVRMGATWNRYGIPGQNLGIDWPLILAHELSHFLLYQFDVYLGVNADGLLVPEDRCTLSAMGDVYAPDNTEFIASATHWDANCATTLAEATLGRNEWETLQMWYPWLIPPDPPNPGPSQMPYGFTSVTILSPTVETSPLEDPAFFLDYANSAVSSSEARAFLLRNGDDDPATFEFVYDLGSPTGGQNRLTARGAQPGDRLCVFDQARDQFGCEIIKSGDDRLQLRHDATWTPLVQVSPVNSVTFGIQVFNLTDTGLSLKAQLYPEFGAVFTETALTYENGAYSGTLTLDYPTMIGHIQLWVDEVATETYPRRETIFGYAIGGNSGFQRASGGGFQRASGGGFLRTGEAPMASTDGQMILFASDEITFAEGQFYTIQSMASLPPLPDGKTALGQGYNLFATSGTPIVTGSISFQYLESDALVEAIDEALLAIHFWDGAGWRVLPSVADPAYNMVSAPGRGPGIYALLAGVTTPHITSVHPAMAVNDFSTVLTLQGSYFLNPLAVALVGPTTTYTLPLLSVSPFSITAVVTQGLPAREYQVVVVNRAQPGGDVASPEPGTFALYDPADACFYDFFESGPGKWDMNGQWAVAALPSDEHAITDSPDGNYNSAIPPELSYTTYITSMPFSLDACSLPLLIFRHDYVLASTLTTQDVATVEVSDDGGHTWHALESYTGGGAFGTQFPRSQLSAQEQEAPEWGNVAWKTSELGLSAYSGTVQLRFGLRVDQDIADKGWVLDDVMVITGTPLTTDLQIALNRTGPAEVPTGAPITYTLTLTNAGPATLDARVTGTFSPTTAATLLTTAPTCWAGDALHCTFDALTRTQTFTLVAYTSPIYSGTLSTLVTISPTYPYAAETSLSNNLSKDDVLVKRTNSFVYLPLILKN